MNEYDDVTIDRVSRVIDLIEGGVPVAALRLALDRSDDVVTLGMVLGLLEDMVHNGVYKP
jgi:hypothetical protein